MKKLGIAGAVVIAAVAVVLAAVSGYRSLGPAPQPSDARFQKPDAKTMESIKALQEANAKR
jgi:uncharacterized protein YdeI (BOF family)